MTSIMDLACGNWYTQMLSVICRLKIPDIIGDNQLHVDEIAERTKTHKPSLFRLLRACTNKGIFIQNEYSFSNSESSTTIRSDHPSCLYFYCLMRGSDYQYRSWSNLIHSIYTGESALNHVFGHNMFEYLDKNPVEREYFDAAMTGISKHVGTEIGMNHPYLFSDAKDIVDIGGGSGQLARSIIGASGMDLQCTVFDYKVSLLHDANNISFVQGSFFEDPIPEGDIYIMKYILHDWGDAQCISILNNIRNSMKRDTKLLIIESLISEDNIPSYHKLLDIQMMVCLDNGAKERTQREYASLLSTCGLCISKVISLSTLDLSILVCNPA